MVNHSSRPEEVSRYILHPDGDIEVWTDRGSRRIQGADVSAIAVAGSFAGLVEYALTLVSGENLLLYVQPCDTLQSLLDHVPNADVDPRIRITLGAHLRAEPATSAAKDPNAEVFRPPLKFQLTLLLLSVTLGLFLVAGDVSTRAWQNIWFGMAWTGGWGAAFYQDCSLRYVVDSRTLALRSLLINRTLWWDEIAVLSIRLGTGTFPWGRPDVLSVLPICGAETQVAFVRRNANLIRLIIRRALHARVDASVLERVRSWPEE